MKDIKCLAKVDGIDYYSESDLLNSIEVSGIIQEEVFLYEDYRYRSLSDNLDIGYCINSIPCFCRTGVKSTESYSYIAVRCCSIQKDKIRFDEACPKCGWGVAAYLAVHCKLDKDFGICYYDVNWSETNKETVFESYLNWRKKIYDIMNIRSYTHYQAIGESASIKMLDEAFYKQHLKEENEYRERSKGMSDNFFDGKLDRVVGEYLCFVSVKMQNATTDNMGKPQRELKDLLPKKLKADEMEERILKELTEIKRYTLLQAKSVLTLDDVALLTGLSKSHLYRLTHTHQIPFYKPNGKTVFFDRNEIEAWMRQNRVGTQQEAESGAIRYILDKEAGL